MADLVRSPIPTAPFLFKRRGRRTDLDVPNLLATTLAGPLPPRPFVPFVDLLPARKRWSPRGESVTRFAGIDGIPFAQHDWPKPARKPWRPAVEPAYRFVGIDGTPFTGMDIQAPERGKWVRTDTPISLLQTTLDAGVVSADPFVPMDWPHPRARYTLAALDATQNLLPLGEVVPPAPVVAFGGHYAKKKLEERPRDDTKDDLERAWRGLTETTEAVREVIASPVTTELPSFVPQESRLAEAMAIAGRVLESIERAQQGAERARLQAAVQAAREAQRQLQERQAAEERARAVAEARHQLKLRRFKAAAMIAMQFLDD